MRYLIRRKFQLINQPFELQYVSSFDEEGRIGYDKPLHLAIALTKEQTEEIIKQFNFIRCEYTIEDLSDA